HTFVDDGTGFKSQHRQDLVWSDDKNFRPVDAEIAPDGSLYLVDWHNMLIGHMQHNARDPLRDHVHGRIYRMTYPSRPLVKPAKIDGATIEELLSNLKLKEYRSRYRTRSELRMRNANEVASKVKTWVKSLDATDPNYEHYLTEALWVSWGVNKIDKSLLEQLLTAKDFRARSAAVHALRYNTDKIANYADLFKKAAKDPQGRVKLEVIAASSWLNNQVGLAIIKEIDTSTLDEWNKPAYETALAHLNNKSVQAPEKTSKLNTNLKGKDLEQFKRGAVIYERDGYCITCHQPNGAGLEISGFPPLN